MTLRFKNISEARKFLGDISFKENSSVGKSQNLKKPLKRNPDAQAIAAKDILSPPHRKLWEAVIARYGLGEAVLELENSVPGRKFRLDIAFPSHMLAIEVDGWQYHGKFKKGFLADREKQNLLVENHWRVLRFTAGQIFNDIDQVMNTIHKAMNAQNKKDADYST